MKRNTCTINLKGFSLLEITMVLIILSLLLSAAIPVMSRAYLEKSAHKTVLDISAIQDAGRKYYIDNNSQWPQATSIYLTPIDALKGNSYLPSGWNAINPFGNSYNASSNASLFNVCTSVPTDAQAIVENALTSPYIDSNGDTCSSVPVPGGGAPSFGTPILENSSSGTASTDGFLMPTCSNITAGNTALLTVSINGSPFVQFSQNGAGTPTTAPLTVPVQKGSSWQVTCPIVPHGSVGMVIYFVPFNS